MVLHRLAEHPPSSKPGAEMPRSYLYALFFMFFIWLGLLVGGVVAIKSLVTLSSPAPTVVSEPHKPDVAEPPSVRPPVSKPPETPEAVPWQMLGAIAFCCAMGTLMIAQRFNPPPRSLLRSPSRTHPNSRKP